MEWQNYQCGFHLKLLLLQAENEKFATIVMGDFNVNAAWFQDVLTSPHKTIPPHFTILEFLTHHHYVDNCVIYRDNPLPTCAFTTSTQDINPSYSRLDYIWLSPTFPINDIVHTELLKSSPFYDSDHLVLATHIDTSTIFATLSNARLKQKKEKFSTPRLHWASGPTLDWLRQYYRYDYTFWLKILH